KSAWEAEFPATAKWVVRAGRKAVIAYPAEAIAGEPFAATWNRLGHSFLRNPQPWRLPWLLDALYDSWTDRTISVLFFDSETGKLLKSLRIPAHGPNLAAWLEGDKAVFATGDRVCWLK
ncbi:MAG TPA: hypothetical protein VGL71_08020, partial [Urbifossiella sp.]